MLGFQLQELDAPAVRYSLTVAVTVCYPRRDRGRSVFFGVRDSVRPTSVRLLPQNVEIGVKAIFEHVRSFARWGKKEKEVPCLGPMTCVYIRLHFVMGLNEPYPPSYQFDT